MSFRVALMSAGMVRLCGCAATVWNRADYLRRQLALPESKRVMRVPEVDARQRMYKP